MELDASIVVAVVSAAATVIGVVSTNRAAMARVEERIDALAERVERHNSVVERTYALEASQAANEERFKTLFNRISSEEKGK